MRLWIWASCMNRIRPTGSILRSTFRATVRHSTTSQASRTSPAPPRPRMGPSTYRPTLGL